MRSNFSTKFNNELEKMRPMTFRQKVSYILSYYKHVFVIIILILICGYYLSDVIIQGSKETVLEGFFTNDEWDLFNAAKLEQDYKAFFELDKHQTVYFDDDLYIDLEGNVTEYTAASNAKIVACIANKELDFIVTTESLFDYYSDYVPMCDLTILLPEDLSARLEEYFYYVTQEGDAAPLAHGIDLTACRYVSGVGAQLEPMISEKYCLFVIQSAPHRDAAAEYIRFLYDW